MSKMVLKSDSYFLLNPLSQEKCLCVCVYVCVCGGGGGGEWGWGRGVTFLVAPPSRIFPSAIVAFLLRL